MLRTNLASKSYLSSFWSYWFPELWCLSVVWNALSSVQFRLMFLSSLNKALSLPSSTQGQCLWLELELYPSVTDQWAKGEMQLCERWTDHFIIAQFLSSEMEWFFYCLFCSLCWTQLFFPSRQCPWNPDCPWDLEQWSLCLNNFVCCHLPLLPHSWGLLLHSWLIQLQLADDL